MEKEKWTGEKRDKREEYIRNINLTLKNEPL
jgi:hypothetical protein